MPRTPTYSSLTNREYWVTQEGRKLYPDQMESSHLVNTIKMLQRNARKYRLQQAKEMCEIHYRFGETDVEPERYYEYFRNEMNMFMDSSISDIDWLKASSKIFYLLVEEAKYRKLDYKEQEVEPPQRLVQARTTGRRRVDWSAITASTIMRAT